MNPRSTFPILRSLCAALALSGIARAADATPAPWWDAAWTGRAKLTLDTSSAAAGLTEPAGTATVLVRLGEGFKFDLSPDGADLRFVSADGKTVYPHQIESYDSTLYEAFVWVKLPEVKPSAQETFYVYYGNAAPVAEAAKPGDAFDGDFSLVYHFAEASAAPVDSTANGNNSETVAGTSGQALIGNALRLLGAGSVVIPAKPSLAWQAGQAFTFSAWVKPTALQPGAVLASRGEGAASFRLLLDKGIPIIEIGGSRSQPGAPVTAAMWTHLAVVADGKTVKLLVDGAPYAELTGALPALDTTILIGGLASGASADGTVPFVGEIDELTLSKTARSTAWIKLAAINQGSTDAAQRTISLSEAEDGEGGGEHSGGVMEHLSLFGDIANNMMFDGWIAIGVCAIMIVVGWTVAVKKFIYLNSIEKGTKVFISQWKSLSTDLTALNTEDKSSVSSLGGSVDESDQALIEKSPLFHIYQIGADEIRHRLDKDNTRVQGLSGRSIQAIRASLDAGLVHESHRLSDGLVYLTISIAGGPYVGLLGTVVGVMITFAIIAKSGEVNVNSIAPGIASALLATVVGLVVAIPALFIYSYLNGRIKNTLALMQVFIDEFVAKMAEFYRPPTGSEPDSTSSGSSH